MIINTLGIIKFYISYQFLYVKIKNETNIDVFICNIAHNVYTTHTSKKA